MTVAEELAEFAHSVDIKDIPGPVLAHAKRIILDQLSVQIACADLPWSTGVYEGITALGGGGPSTVVRYGDNIGVDDAAYVNSAFGHAFEMDDISIKSINHVGCHAVPTALAVGQQQSNTGVEFLTAVTACSEIINRLSGIASRSLLSQGLNVHPPVNGYATAAVTGKLLGVSQELIREAVSIAGSYTIAGLREYNQTGGSVKRVSGAIPTVSGIRAGYMAEHGVTGPPTVFEGKWGWKQFYIPEVENVAPLTTDLGSTWNIQEVGFKAYCANYFTQPGIELAIRMREQHDIEPGMIKSIEFGTFAETIQHAGQITRPADVLSAQYSAAFVIALAFQFGDVGFEQYTEENMTDKSIIELAEKVELYVDEQAENEYQDSETGLSHSAVMTVRLNDGREFEQRIQSAEIKGNLENQLTDDEVIAKATRLTEPILGATQATELAETVMSLENVDNINDLGRLLVAE